jgi:protein-S-isoprenylcysteine O-methyltransferase Ste14
MPVYPCVPAIRQSGRSQITPRFYDLAMRLPILVWASLLAAHSMRCLAQDLRNDLLLNSTATSAAMGVAARSAVIAYLVIVAATVIVRLPPIAQAPGRQPRLTALLGTFFIMALAFFPAARLSLAGEGLSMLLIFLGNALAVLVLLKLRASFSIMAEARELVTTGAYRHIRHPLYLAEGIAAFGVLVQVFSPWTVLVMALHVAFQLKRMGNEEQLLQEAFPDYEAYKRGTARLIPGLY